MLTETIASFVEGTAGRLGVNQFEVSAVLALILVSLTCGMVGSLVVGNRMAFFSDAMAHSAFAGVALGSLTAIAAGAGRDPDTMGWLVPLVMVLFGAGVGAAIVYIRERTSLAADTVI